MSSAELFRKEPNVVTIETLTKIHPAASNTEEIPKESACVAESPEDRRQRFFPETPSFSASQNTSEQTERPKDDPVVLNSLASLITEYGAQWITHWMKVGTDKQGNALLQASSDAQECSDAIRSKTEDLAREALQKKSVVSQLLSAKIRCFLVAAPVPAVPDCVLSIAFPLNRLGDIGNGLEQRANMELRC